LPFPTNWEEIKAEVLKWSADSNCEPTIIDVLDYLKEKYYSPFEREKSNSV